jgi:hypothetical protein
MFNEILLARSGRFFLFLVCVCVFVCVRVCVCVCVCVSFIGDVSLQGYFKYLKLGQEKNGVSWVFICCHPSSRHPPTYQRAIEREKKSILALTERHEGESAS